jgi:DNA topoisomerase-1
MLDTSLASSEHDALDVTHAARSAELRYVHDDEPGWHRVRRGRGFSYVDARGRPVRDVRALDRVKALAIPPAWTHVWICASPDGHIQATGRDARGRKQYRYHARWRVVRDEAKFDLVFAFASALPALRRRVAHDLMRVGLDREKVVAALIAIMEHTCVRVGNDCYAATNHSFGLTTLRDRHAHFVGDRVTFDFVGKSKKVHHVAVRDPRLAAIVRRCRDIPGQRLFQWIDADGQRHPVTSNDVNEYIREACRGPFTAKMVRTWTATVMAARLLFEAAPCASVREGKRTIASCLETVSSHLGNTPAISRKSYIHPRLIDEYTRGTLHETMARAREASAAHKSRWLSRDELMLLALFDERHGARKARRAA